jgi:hypothetical protein
MEPTTTPVKPRPRKQPQAEPTGAQARAINPLVVPDGTMGTPVTAALVRRLAESADGHRDGKTHWVVTSPDDPTTEKLQSFPSLAAAKTYRDQQNAAGGNFDVFGPFQTPRDPAKLPRGHKKSVKKVTVELEDEAGGKYTAVIDGDKSDALFWSSSSIDKFAVPYYVGVADVEFGMKVRDDFDRADVYMMVHLPDTTYTTSFIEKKQQQDPADPADDAADDPGPGLTYRQLTPP